MGEPYVSFEDEDLQSAQTEGPVDLIWQMQTRQAEFSRSEQRLAALILADEGAALNDSIVELSARADVSPPTVTRFCRRLGCRSYGDFKVRLAQSRVPGARYLTRPNGPKTAYEIANGVFSGAHDTLTALFQGLDYAALDAAAVMIADASYVLAFGSGGVSSMVAAEIENRLFRLGLAATSSIDHQGQLMRAAAAPVGTSVVVAASVSGRNKPLGDALATAGEYGIPRIVLTRPGTPVAAYADVLLVIDLAESQDILRPTGARYAYLAMLDVLVQMVATRLGDRAVESMRRIKHNLLLFRDEDDRQPLGD